MKEIFVVGDIIQSLSDGRRAVVLDKIPNDNKIWLIDEDGECDHEQFATENWKKIGHTKAVGTLLNVLKEG